MRVVVSVLCFLLGLCLGIEALRALPEPKISESAGALEHLMKHGDNYDLIVVGSSVVRMHFIAGLFDKEMKKHGYRIKSFGFSRSSLHGGELDYYLERILELHHARLKWVVVDVSLKQFRAVEEGNAYKRRVIEWHAPRQYWHLQRFVLATKKGPLRVIKALASPAAHALLRYAGVGVGIEALRKGTLLHEYGKVVVKPRASFHPSASLERGQRKKMERYRQRLGAAHVRDTKELARLRLKPPVRPQTNEYADLFRDQIEAHGLTAMFLLAPTLGDNRMNPHVKGKPDLRFFDFNQPRKYPELYDVNVRYDRIHLAWPGAQLFTKAFAARFAEWLEAEGDTRTLIKKRPRKDER